MSRPEYEQPIVDTGLQIRIKLLSEIKRYEGTQMTHRTDLFTHTYRTAYIAVSLGYELNALSSSGDDFDLTKLYRMGLHHDDAEFITGDIVSPVKSALTHKEKILLKEKENQGVDALAHFLYDFTPKEQNRYILEQEELAEKLTPEAQLLNVADKYDAIGEILHDIRCGNENLISLIPFSQDKFQQFQNYSFWNHLADI